MQTFWKIKSIQILLVLMLQYRSTGKSSNSSRALRQTQTKLNFLRKLRQANRHKWYWWILIYRETLNKQLNRLWLFAKQTKSSLPHLWIKSEKSLKTFWNSISRAQTLINFCQWSHKTINCWRILESLAQKLNRLLQSFKGITLQNWQVLVLEALL